MSVKALFFNSSKYVPDLVYKRAMIKRNSVVGTENIVQTYIPEISSDRSKIIGVKPNGIDNISYYDMGLQRQIFFELTINNEKYYLYSIDGFVDGEDNLSTRLAFKMCKASDVEIENGGE